jgi:hypothetical protein
MGGEKYEFEPVGNLIHAVFNSDAPLRPRVAQHVGQSSISRLRGRALNLPFFAMMLKFIQNEIVRHHLPCARNRSKSFRKVFDNAHSSHGRDLDRR